MEKLNEELATYEADPLNNQMIEELNDDRAKIEAMLKKRNEKVDVETYKEGMRRGVTTVLRWILLAGISGVLHSVWMNRWTLSFVYISLLMLAVNVLVTLLVTSYYTKAKGKVDTDE